MIAIDKQAHFLAGAVITLAVGYVAPVLVAFIVTVVVGWAKELYDHFHPATHTADKWDFVATALGGGVASLFIFAETSMNIFVDT
jgi:hypothetical protein